jgi:molecular chaperone GrpE
MAENDESQEPVEPVVHDKRRVDPETGKVRHPEASASEGAGSDDSAPSAGAARPEGAGNADEGYEGPDVETSPSGDELRDDELNFLSGQSSAEDLAAERLADLQRVTAEYANYRKRTEANREAERERAVADTAKAILPVLDDLDRAEKHGDLDGDTPFATIAGKLRQASERLGLKPFGSAGEVFDHNVHEAIFQQPSPEVTEPTVIDVVEVGYTLGGTLVRAAKVVVAVPQN